MNERIREFEKQCWETKQVTNDAHSWHTSFNAQKFADLLYNDIMTVVAAHALSNDSAMTLYKNLISIYEVETK